jgi:large subunit ribosomal protein L3
MVDALLGKKLGMTQVFTETGVTVPVTVIQVEPNHVTQVKTPERDGYAAVQLGFDEARRLSKAETGHLKGLPKLRHLREVGGDSEGIEVGQAVGIDIFTKGEIVDVIGVSKGKGFAGVVKRHGFAGGPKTHGQSDRHRAPGSIGASSTPGRVFKGMRMAGHLGNERRTVQNLEVVGVDADRNVLLIKGSIPGARNGVVMVRKAVKQKRGSASQGRATA